MTSVSMPTDPLRVAAVQAKAVPGDVPGNVATAARFVARAADEGAALVVFPELFVPAYHPPTLAADPGRCDVPADPRGLVTDRRLDLLAAAATEHGLTVVIGASVRHPDQCRTISLLTVDPAGAVSVAYDKQHLWGHDEPALFTPGTRDAVIEVEGWRLGLGVCFDGSFPEHARAAALAGAHGYLCPSVFLIGRNHRRDIYFPARALENTMYVVFTNGVGGADSWHFSGGAAIFNPEGRELARAPAHDPAVVCAKFESDELARIRTELPMLEHCRSASHNSALLTQ